MWKLFRRIAGLDLSNFGEYVYYSILFTLSIIMGLIITFTGNNPGIGCWIVGFATGMLQCVRADYELGMVIEMLDGSTITYKVDK